ncbi:YjfK family protein [Vibrio algarum]|uniref:YjfK family protein n=1 Tax=Vibrio algarum TaxID=3020714 RepID=A0ABT4YT73_9VIBR|nr:YjfK family protein [Vibrio sp. KJ40-1]MDB1124767.1 YjfK family protein [Vibrio sp. KJ40-1]
MFGWFKKKEQQPQKPSSPEVLGLRLGGAIELDDLKFRLIEEYLTIEGAARTQLIKAVGEVELDGQTRLLRFYTDDDGYFQVLQNGKSDADVAEVKLVYFYETKPIDSDKQWEHWLASELVKPNKILDEQTFYKVWENERPVAMTEKTWFEDGSVSETDQFAMVYEREINPELFEGLQIIAEEKIENNQPQRSVVFSTSIDVSPTDFRVIG